MALLTNLLNTEPNGEIVIALLARFPPVLNEALKVEPTLIHKKKYKSLLTTSTFVHIRYLVLSSSNWTSHLVSMSIFLKRSMRCQVLIIHLRFFHVAASNSLLPSLQPPPTEQFRLFHIFSLSTRSKCRYFSTCYTRLLFKRELSQMSSLLCWFGLLQTASPFSDQVRCFLTLRISKKMLVCAGCRRS